jgi:hypothetical protein
MRGVGLHPIRAGTSQSAFPLTNAPNGTQSPLDVQMLVRRLDQQKKAIRKGLIGRQAET